MAKFPKPNTINTVWATVGERIKPSDEKILMGWGVEIPPLQYENWSQHRQDQAIAHFNQYGIAEWDRYTQYVAGKSYVQGEDGFIYKALVDNINTNPTQDKESWATAFVSADNEASVRLFNGYIIFSSTITATTNSRYYAISTSTIILPAVASSGDNVIINKAPSAEVTIEVAGDDGKIRTLMGLADAVIFDVQDELNVVFDGTHWQTS